MRLWTIYNLHNNYIHTRLFTHLNPLFSIYDFLFKANQHPFPPSSSSLSHHQISIVPIPIEVIKYFHSPKKKVNSPPHQNNRNRIVPPHFKTKKVRKRKRNATYRTKVVSPLSPYTQGTQKQEKKYKSSHRTPMEVIPLQMKEKLRIFWCRMQTCVSTSGPRGQELMPSIYSFPRGRKRYER